jgi:hypothetical protein
MFSICQGSLKIQVGINSYDAWTKLKHDIHLGCKSVHKGATGEGYSKKMAWQTALKLENKHLT